jgi:tetrahydromethanopterin S-methyltransferase subunit B
MQYKLQIKGKWQSFTVPQMVRAIYAAQQGVHPTASGVFLTGFILGLVIAAIFALVLFGGE